MIPTIHWGSIYYVWLVPFLVFAIMCTVFRAYKKIAIASLLSRAKVGTIRYFSKTKVWTKVLLMSIGSLMLFLALLSPQWTKKDETVTQQGRDLVIALDVSRSMLATDAVPNRLQAAKEKIKRLLKLCSCERVGLVLFSGAAFVQCPLTSDYSSFLMFLDHVDVETISSGATALDQAIKQGLDMYQVVPDRKHKLLVLFTDGEDFSSNLHRYKQEAAAQEMHIFTIGMGTAQGAPIPLFNEHGNQIGHQKDENGSVVITKLNEPLLKTMADEVGGTYIKARDATVNDMLALQKEIERFEKEAVDEKRFSHYENQYPYFLLISFICFALEWIV